MKRLVILATFLMQLLSVIAQAQQPRVAKSPGSYVDTVGVWGSNPHAPIIFMPKIDFWIIRFIVGFV